jgi:Leucine-rich repeat (LRR) protein
MKHLIVKIQFFILFLLINLNYGLAQDYSKIKKTIKFSKICDNAKTIKKIDVVLSEPQNIISLKLTIKDSSDFVKLVSQIPKLTKLRKVIIDNYYDYNLELPQEFWNLSQLEFVSLHNIRINSFKGLESLTEIKYLTLMGARMKSIPNEIYQLSNLEYLDFNLNYINSIPEDINKLKKLRELDLTNNCFVRIPKSVTQLPHIEYLDFDNAETVNNKFVDGQPFCYNQLSSYPDLSKMNALIKISVYRLSISDCEIIKKLSSEKRVSGKIKTACTNK